MALDPVKNFAISRVATAPSPATSGTTLVVESGDGALFPDPSVSGEYNVVVYPNGEQPTSTNAEIVRVTARTSDTMTITREQESTSARTIVEGDIVMLGITAKVIGDIQDVAEEAEALISEFNGGWVDTTDETWTYASADDPTFTFTISGDKTSKYSAGMRIKLTQTSVKYFIITAVSYSSPNTTITVYGGTDYDLANATITNPYYSTQKAPQGFPMSPAKWSVTVAFSGGNQQSPVNGTWYNVASNSITLPIGCWSVEYLGKFACVGSGGYLVTWATLSTGNNTESDTDLTVHMESSAGITQLGYLTLYSRKVLTMASKTVMYLNLKTTSAQTTGIYITTGSRGNATCAYL